MSGKDRYRKLSSAFAGRKEDKPLVFSGTLGITTNAENQVEVPGRPGFVWVQLRNQLNETIQAFNDGVSPVFGLPVLVEWDKDSPTRYKIRGRDTGRYTVWTTTNAAGDTVSDTSAYLPAHGSQHSFNKYTGVGGGDIAWIYSDQFMPWAVTPSGSAGSLSVSVQPSAYYYDQQFRWAGGTGIAGLDVLRPTGTSNARMILVYLDPDTGNPYLATGTLTEFANTITGTQQIMPYMPSLIEETDIPLAGIRLITGTNKILWQNLYDLRDYFAHSSTSGSSGGGGAPTDAQYVVMALNGDLSAERVLTAGDDVVVSDGGAGGNATVGVITGSFSRPGHTHAGGAGTNELPIFDDSVFKATGTLISFDDNLTVHVTGSTIFIDGQAGGGGGGSTILIYEDDVFQVTGTAIDFGDNMNVAVTGSVAYVSSTGGGGGGSDISVRVRRTTDQAIPYQTGTAIIFDTEDYDTDGIHSGSSTQLYVNTAGKYAIWGTVAWEVSNAGFREVEIVLNDSTVIGGIADSPSLTLTQKQTAYTEYDLDVGDYVTLEVWHNNAVTNPLDVLADDNTPQFGMHLLGGGVGATGSAGPPGDNTILVSEDSIFKATGTHIDFGENMNVAVTGTTVFVSSVDTTGGGGSDLLIYDNDVFQVTGTALDFGDYLNVSVTGSIAYINSPFSPTGFDIGARVYSNTGTSISTSTLTPLSFDSERYDTDGIHSGSSTQLYCNTAGKYYIGGNVQFVFNDTGTRFALIRLNGTTSIAIQEVAANNQSSRQTQLNPNCIYDLSIGDYVELTVYQTSGGDLEVASVAQVSPEFWMHKIDGGGNAIQVYDDGVWKATGTHIDFGENMNVAVTGSVVFVSSVDTQGGGGSDLLIYDDSEFKVTGTALDFGNYMNVAVTGSVAYISSSFSPTGFDIGARVYRSTGTIINNNSWTSIPFDTERYDTDEIHSGSSTQLYCNTAGKYVIVGGITFGADADAGLRQAGIRLNGSTYIQIQTEDTADLSGGTHVNIATIYDLEVGDYVELQAYQTTGDTLTVTSTANVSPEFMMHKIDGGGNAIQVYDDGVWKATGTSIDFGANLDVSVTGNSVWVDGQAGGGGADLLIYDDGAFKVTGTSIDFESGLTVDVTGSSAFINSTFSTPVGIGARVYKSSNQTITGSAFQILTFDSESYDTDSMHDPSTNNSRITVNTAGKYLCNASVLWENNSTNVRLIRFFKNGSDYFGLDRRNAINNSEATISAVIDLDVGDYVEVQVYQNSGGNLSITGGNELYTFFALQLIEVGDQDNTLQIYDDSVFVATGTAISFDEGLDVVSTGTTAYVGLQDIGARVYNSTDQNITGSVWQVLLFDSEDYDTDGIHSTVTNTDRLTCQTAGKYLITFNGRFDPNATGDRQFQIRYYDGVDKPLTHTITPGHASFLAGFSNSAILDMSVGDYVYARVFQDSGGGLNIDSTDGTSPYFSMHKIDGGGNAIQVYDDGVWKATGTTIDFGANLDVSVTGNSVWVDGQAGGGSGDLLIYDNDVFQVTGTALDFGDYLNVAVTGSIAYISSPFSPTGFDIGARVYSSTGTVISNGSTTTIEFDSERYDTDGIHSGSSSQLYCNTAGKYIIHGQVEFADNQTGVRNLYIQLNGTTYLNIVNNTPSPASFPTRMEIATIADLSVGDYVELRAYQNSGGDLSLVANDQWSVEFMMQRIA